MWFGWPIKSLDPFFPYLSNGSSFTVYRSTRVVEMVFVINASSRLPTYNMDVYLGSLVTLTLLFAALFRAITRVAHVTGALPLALHVNIRDSASRISDLSLP